MVRFLRGRIPFALAFALAGCGPTPPDPTGASLSPDPDQPVGCVAAANTHAVPAPTPRSDGSDRVAALEVKVLAFARAHEGEVLGKERCSELADLALVSSGARTFTDFGTGASENTYVWGTSVEPKDARPGDVIQFEDVAISQTTATFLSRFRERFTATRQTAIVAENDRGAMAVYEQNIGGDPAVRLIRVYVASGTYARDAEGAPDTRAVTTVKVSGTIRAYRPQPR